ncbi:putative TetR family transcriptional regulator [Gordonia hirsuta DSM 44140 = NBRC 16056]|uniref:Putative TetR family transcriptional regulator n=1 Tax=Gordonia hirsuta DSM 44140 = NBRC 16056 TaxID=1121927 RepID=L7LEI8_9ACTN|nr:TetR/AcrR family transcriptional regulator [Gordonia hirsuta]GAC58472.1 putative TetR family transcriptional regulator [Gordonia hirsuta DSM 44140 = NBRC 16056]
MATGAQERVGRRTQEQRSAQTRRKLLDATVACLVDYGYAGTTTSKVAGRAGVTRGAQLHHFGSRQDLVSAAVQHLAAMRTAEAVAQLGAVRDSGDPVGALLELIWDLHDGPLFVASVELWVAARTDPVLREEVAAFERTVDGAVAGAAAGLFAPDVEREVLNFVYTAMDALRGILISGFIDPGSGRPRRRWDRACAVLRKAIDPAALVYRSAPAGD